jgi:translocation and assembly module TamA
MVALTVCGTAPAQDEVADESAAPEQIRYRVEITGDTTRELRRRLRAASESIQRRKIRPESLNQLRLRARRDLTNFGDVLRSEGYYNGEVAMELFEDESRPRVVFDVQPGPRYTIDWSSVRIDHADSKRPSVPPLRELGLRRGTSARADDVLDAEDAIVEHLRDNGYPYARALPREVIVDHATRTMDVRYRVESGSVAYFGPLKISGLEAVDESVVRPAVPWEEGDLYSDAQVRRLRARLYGRELFTQVRLTPADAPDENGRVPIQADFSERLHRTYGFGLGYSTDLGVQTKAFWEHRNMEGLGRRLRLEADLGQTLNELSATYRMNQFFHPDQTLRLRGGVRHFDPPGFTESGVSAEAVLSRDITDPLNVSAGVRFRAEQVEQFDERDTFVLLSFPLGLEYDRANNLLDPTRGYRLSLGIEPTRDLLGASTYIKTQSIDTVYLTPRNFDTLTFAGRLKFGTIMGESVGNIPASDRFYAGGAGSVRGYAYQTVGPLIDDDPIGGRSVLEASAEMRVRLPQSFGLVAFVDGGTAFSDALWGSGESLLFGAGIGLRYHTAFGPIRFDVAIPLDRRSGVDNAFEVYFSIGQAF